MSATSTRTTREYILLLARADAHRFREGFADWLNGNWAIWERFLQEARKVKIKGRVHYSARTIIEYIRHETAMADSADADFKINNNVAPDMARLYGLVSGDNDLFELRGRA